LYASATVGVALKVWIVVSLPGYEVVVCA
jgi:hypothetical protein